MTVFLRWGVFGILAVAALLYAYNASKDLARKREATPGSVVSQEDAAADEAESAGYEPATEPEESTDSMDEAELEMPPECEDEKLVAERALKFRRDGEPLDGVLRIQVIVFQDDEKRRERLEAVARRWYEREGRDPNAAALHAEVLRECLKAAPAP